TVIPCTPIDDSASRTSSSLNGLMIAVTSFIGFPWSECLADGKHDGALAGGLRLRSDTVEEAVELAGAAVALRVGIDVSRAEHPAAEVLGDPEFPVAVTGVG